MPRTKLSYRARAALPLALIFLLALLALLAPAARQSALAAPGPADAAVLFVANAGQAGPAVRFVAVGAGAALLATDGGIWLRAQAPAGPARDPEALSARPSAEVQLSFDGASQHPRIEPFGRLPARVSYLIGQPRDWHADLPTWAGIRYVDIYPGIDLELTSARGRLVQRVVARAGANPAIVRLRVAGADQVALSGDALRLSTAAGALSLPLPELISAAGSPGGAPLLSGAVVERPFASAGSPAPSAADGDLAYAVAIGSPSSSLSNGIAADSAGAAYITGYAESPSFTPPGVPSNLTAYVVKLDPSGALVYASFIGGNGDDNGSAITVDSSGAAYITGATSSTDFPTSAGAYDRTVTVDTCDGGHPHFPVPCTDAFVAKLSPDGTSLSFATLLGGPGRDVGLAIALGADNSPYIAGYTHGGLPTSPGAYERTAGGGFCPGFLVPIPCNDGFAAHLGSSGGALLYSTLLSGQFEDKATALAVDAGGAAYIGGYTDSPDFGTTPGAFRTALPPAACVQDYSGSYPCFEGFAFKLSPSGASAAYATLLGGQKDDRINALAIDAGGSAYLAGQTGSADFPTTAGALDRALTKAATCDNDYTNCDDAFVAKLAPAGGALSYATLLGGERSDQANAIAVNSAGEAFVAGETASADFPVTPGAHRTITLNALGDAFVARLDASGGALAYASLIGDVGGEQYTTLATDSAGNAYLTSYVGSAYVDEPLPPPYILGGSFAVKLATPPFIYRAAAAIPPAGGSLTATLDTASYSFPAGTFASTASFTHTSQLARDTPPAWPLLQVGHSFVNTATLAIGGQPAQPASPYSITMRYASGLGAIEPTLALYRWDGAAWVKEPTSAADPASHTVTASPSQLGRWAVLGETRHYFLPLAWRNHYP